MSKLIISLKDVSKKDTSLCGGKGAHLGELLEIGAPVPSGFVITTVAYQNFLKDNGLDQKIKEQLLTIDKESLKSVNSVSGRITRLILKSQIDSKLQREILRNFNTLATNYVAVRSSATCEDNTRTSFAGQLSTYLNTTENELIENIKKCWTSVFLPRALLYQIRHGLNKRIVFVAVVIQEMVDAEVSGIAFTSHPVTKDSDVLLIEAGYGLGEAIVSGLVTPDNYVVDKKKLAVRNFKIGKQKKMVVRQGTTQRTIDVPEKSQTERKLSETKISELVKLCLKIENYYNSPQDIEWALEKDKFFILQTRPITTL